MSAFTELPEIKLRTFAESELAFAVLTHMPITVGHSLVIPKREVATIEELTDHEWADIHALTIEVMERLEQLFGAEGYNCAWNQGANFGQSVPHFHLHIVPRTPADSGIDTYEPRKFLYRPGSRATSAEEELAELADQLRGVAKG